MLLLLLLLPHICSSSTPPQPPPPPPQPPEADEDGAAIGEASDDSSADAPADIADALGPRDVDGNDSDDADLAPPPPPLPPPAAAPPPAPPAAPAPAPPVPMPAELPLRIVPGSRKVKIGELEIGNYKFFGGQAAIYCSRHGCKKIWRAPQAPSDELVKAWFRRGLSIDPGSGNRDEHMATINLGL